MRILKQLFLRFFVFCPPPRNCFIRCLIFLSSVPYNFDARNYVRDNRKTWIEIEHQHIFTLQRKLQRCIKHIQDKHGVSVDSEPTDDSIDSPRVIADPDTMASPTFYPTGIDDCSQESSMNGDINDSFDGDTLKIDSEAHSSDQFSADFVATGDVPNEDELFFLSKADYRCSVDKCVLLGPHYHCNRCPYVTRQVQRLYHVVNLAVVKFVVQNDHLLKELHSLPKAAKSLSDYLPT